MRTFALSIVLVCAAAGCRLPVVVGSINCRSDKDCSPPSTLCGVDQRCVPGCVTASCFAGASCSPTTGACTGEVFGTSCTSASGCDAPEVVCSAATSTCAASCVLTGTCPSGLFCDRSSGHCCDPDESGCSASHDPVVACVDDDDCASPTRFCQSNVCTAGCITAGCDAPKTCNAATGHCTPATCARDSDCDDTSMCTQAHVCVALGLRGYGDCAGGTEVDYTCAMANSAASFAACTDDAGPSSCPFCIDDSCFAPGLCATSAECSAGLACTNGLCVPQSPQCPTTVELEDVVKGRYAAGKVVCVRAKVTSVRSGYDGVIELRLGTSPYLYADVLEMHRNAGVKIPTVGDLVTVQGIVRWDYGHGDRELLPVDWIGD